MSDSTTIPVSLPVLIVEASIFAITPLAAVILPVAISLAVIVLEAISFAVIAFATILSAVILLSVRVSPFNVSPCIACNAPLILLI